MNRNLRGDGIEVLLRALKFRPRYIKNLRYPKYLENTVCSDKKTCSKITIGHS